MQKSLDYSRTKRADFLEQLVDFLRIPSISTLPEYSSEVARAAEWLATELKRIGMENIEVYTTPGHPIVYSDLLHNESAPTILIYGHYDVQPVDPIEEWASPPFEPTTRDGKIYARGSTDDKGQVFMQIKALEACLHENGRLPVNVKVIFEGEEESGSVHLDNWIQEHAEMLAANTVLISDSSWLNVDQPTIPYSLRGIAAAEIHVYGPNHDLHSGGYGGTVHNPASALARIIAALHDQDGHVTIPGFYDRVRILSQDERAELQRVPRHLEDWQRETGLEKPWGEPGYSLIERTGTRPTCEVNGMWSGFTGTGGKTIIPAEAHAKITMRLVANQDPLEIQQLFSKYVMSLAPDDLSVAVETSPDVGWPATTPIDCAEMKAAKNVYQTVWGTDPVFIPGGGSIPVVATLQRALDIPVVLMGFGLPDSGVHAPNEWLSLDQLEKGIEALIRYYYALAS